MILSRTYLETVCKYSKRFSTIQNTIKEILTHERKCENQKCKEKGWSTLKVIDVEYIGLTDDEVQTFENFYKSDDGKSNELS